MTNKEIKTLSSQELEILRFERERQKWKRRKQRTQEWLQKNPAIKEHSHKTHEFR